MRDPEIGVAKIGSRESRLSKRGIVRASKTPGKWAPLSFSDLGPARWLILMRLPWRVRRAGVKAPESAILDWIRAISPESILAAKLCVMRAVANAF